MTKKATKKVNAPKVKKPRVRRQPPKKNNDKINQVVSIVINGSSKSKSKSRKSTTKAVPLAQMLPNQQSFRTPNPDASVLGELATIRTSVKEQQAKVGQLDEIKRDVARAYIDLTGDGVDAKEEKDFKRFITNLDKAGRQGLLSPFTTPAKTPRVKFETPQKPRETPIRPNQNFRTQDQVKLAKRYGIEIPQDLQALIDGELVGGKKQAGLQKKLAKLINEKLDEQEALQFQQEEFTREAPKTTDPFVSRRGSLDDSFLREMDDRKRRLSEMIGGGQDSATGQGGAGAEGDPELSTVDLFGNDGDY